MSPLVFPSANETYVTLKFAVFLLINVIKENCMSQFASQPPSKKEMPAGKLFCGGMMPVPTEHAAMIVIDIRNLKLSHEEGKKLQTTLLACLYAELEKRVDLSNRSVVDLSASVLGVAIE